MKIMSPKEIKLFRALLWGYVRGNWLFGGKQAMEIADKAVKLIRYIDKQRGMK